MDSVQGIGPKVDMNELETEEAILTYESRKKQEQMNALPHRDYMKIAYEKLEQLKKHTKLRMTLGDDDDFDDDDDFGMNSDDDEE